MTVDELIENFSLFDEWEDRYRYLVDLGKQLPGLDEGRKTDLYKVEGCLSQVWLVPGVRGERFTFEADSDSAIVRGLIAVLKTVYDNRTPQEILAVDIERVFDQLGLSTHISPNRRNGFFAMVETIRKTAQAAVGAA